MRISSFFIPLFVLLAGLAGALLRIEELSVVFDAVTGFPERNSTITLALVALSIFVIFVVIIYAVIAAVKCNVASDFDNAFGTDSFIYPTIYIVGGIVWLGATIVFFINLNVMSGIETLDVVFTVFSAMSAISIMIFAVEVYKNPRRKLISMLSLMPTLFTCFWLVLIYRDNASNPVLLDYAYACLAMIFAALGFYFTSAFAFGKPAKIKPIVCYSAAIYFSFVKIVDDFPMSIKLIIGTIILLNFFNLSALLRNLQKKIKN